MWKQLRLFLLSLSLVFLFSIDDDFLRSNLTSPPSIPQEELFEVEAWKQQLGNRIRTIRHNIETVSRVVLVPDKTTFLTAIQQWNLRKRYPILIEDDYYTKLFLNRFQPEEVIRLSAVETPLPEARQTVMKNAVAAAWETKQANLKQTWEQLEWQPPGVVITSVHDPAWVAAVALAADRGEPLLFLEDYFGGVNQTLGSSRWKQLKQQVNSLVKSTGYNYQQLGDPIDTITLVRHLPVKYYDPDNHELLAVTDGLGRDQDGERYAITGWIFGTPERAVYQAMSAIFLPTETALLYDSYPQTKAWKKYHFQNSKAILEQLGIKSNHIEVPKASQDTWQNLINQPWEYDLTFINSKGGKDQFAVGNGNASIEDIPELEVPTAMHMIHSFSATTPANINTIAGRWLNNGAYAFVGSVNEPYVTGFVPPNHLIQELSSYVPFLVASRYQDAPPWKITTIGDPLMLITTQLNSNSNS